MSENRENMFKNDMGCGVGVRGVSRLIEKKNEIRGVRGRGREARRKRQWRRRKEIKREGEPACLHASNLLMVEGKQTISHYLSET